MHRRRRAPLAVLAVSLSLALGAFALPATASSSSSLRAASKAAAVFNAANLDQAAVAVEQEALTSHALHAPVSTRRPAQVLLAAAEALIAKARRQDPSLTPADTRAVMGPVPSAVSHHLRKRAHHHHVSVTHTLSRFSHALPDAGSTGVGMRPKHHGAKAALLQQPDAVYVDPHLPRPAHPTVGMVALRAALQQLGQPYVWAAAGPTTYDCSGLTQWAYAHAGVPLAHYTGDQWNEGRLLPGRDILPGDLLLFGSDIHHVGMYLGAGWMVNAPYTGQYVNVVQVPAGLAGVIRP
jgi:cell wall-associated NlpC family hydrolase